MITAIPFFEKFDEAYKLKKDKKLGDTNLLAQVQEETQNLSKNLKKKIAKEVQKKPITNMKAMLVVRLKLYMSP